MRVGFIGLGRMGLPMARRLLGAGHQLVVYNRTAERADSLLAEGARVARSPREAALDVDAPAANESAVFESAHTPGEPGT
jgi:3-hydroxyisobutyrate dehydrogenase-like beta-hydroxyacid dehydrogenase